jgi:D-alanine-D-alanine ligase
MADTSYSRRRPRLTVGLTYNLKQAAAATAADEEAEFDDPATILAIRQALEAAGCQVQLLEATDDLPVRLARERPDIVFNIAEGRHGRGREAQVPALLSYQRIPYTGSDETTLALALDKALTKRILASHHIRTPRYAVVGPNARPGRLAVSFPAIIKPNAEGSGKGIHAFSIVNNRDELRRLLAENIALYHQDMLVESFVAGREFTVGLLGNGADIRVFPAMEIVYKDRSDDRQIYSYEVKKNYRDYVDYECPARLEPAAAVELEQTARAIYRILGCRDLARIDFRMTPAGELHFIEINPLPGLAPGYSDFPMIAEYCGMAYEPLIQSILAAALQRYHLPRLSDRGIQQDGIYE